MMRKCGRLCSGKAYAANCMFCDGFIRKREE